MGQPIQVNVPDHIVQLAQQIADEQTIPLEKVLIGWFEQGMGAAPMDWLPDDQIMYLSEMMLSDEQQEELSDLLYLNREGELTPSNRVRLDEMMRLYSCGMLVKAHALAVAVKRGLHPRLDAVQD
jgi:hypothetical protein